jgi:hypothetical protein
MFSRFNKPDVKQSDLLTIQEAASFLNLSIPCLYNKGKQGMSYEKERDFTFLELL